MIRRIGRALLLSVGFAASFSGMSHAQSGTYKVGSFLSLTGPAAFLGDPEEKTLKLFVEKLNAAGGVAGRKLELVIYDDGGDSNKARTLVSRLIDEDKVDIIIGGSLSGASLAVIPIVEEAKMPYISLASAISITDPVKRWVFKTPLTDRMVCERIYAELKQRGLTKVGLLSSTDGYGQSMQKECKATSATFGVQIVADETYGPRDTDMTAQLTNIARAPGLQAIVNTGFGQTGAIVTRNYAQLAIKAPLYQSSGVASDEFLKLAGPAANGIRFAASALVVGDQLPDNDPIKPTLAQYVKEYQDRWKISASLFGGYAYDAMAILVDSLKRAKSMDKAGVRDAIEQTKAVVGTSGIYTMSPQDHNGLSYTSLKMIEIKDQKFNLTF
jgi:branched-chain amino acid transport system substrate-binding protein